MTQDYARGISEENRPGLKYLVIPIEVLCNKKLSYTDKVIFAIVDLFDNKNHCYATNEYLARVLEVSSQTVSNSINVLIDHEYLEKIGFDGSGSSINASTSLLVTCILSAKRIMKSYSDSVIISSALARKIKSLIKAFLSSFCIPQY